MAYLGTASIFAPTEAVPRFNPSYRIKLVALWLLWLMLS